MTKYHPQNERIKRDYFRWLAEADSKSEMTIDGIRKSILRFEEYTRFKDFGTFNKEQAIAFKKHLAEQKAEQSDKPLSKATCLTTLHNLQAFLRWLARERGYKSRIHFSDIEYLSMNDKDMRAARSGKPVEFPTIEQVRHVVQAMPHQNDIQKRDRAVIAFIMLTGIRDSALISLNLRHIDVDRGLVNQDPKEVKTKFSKRIDTFFFPVGEDFVSIVMDWVSYLKTEKLYGLDEPLFPKTSVQPDANQCFAVSGLEANHWKTTQPIRNIFREAFANAGIKYYKPHSLRHTLVHYGEQICQNPEQFKAWSQNLGHESTLTTFHSYGTLSLHRQGEVIGSIGQNQSAGDMLSILRDIQATIAPRP